MSNTVDRGLRESMRDVGLLVLTIFCGIGVWLAQGAVEKLNTVADLAIKMEERQKVMQEKQLAADLKIAKLEVEVEDIKLKNVGIFLRLSGIDKLTDGFEARIAKTENIVLRAYTDPTTRHYAGIPEVSND